MEEDRFKPFDPMAFDYHGEASKIRHTIHEWMDNGLITPTQCLHLENLIDQCLAIIPADPNEYAKKVMAILRQVLDAVYDHVTKMKQ